MAAEDGVYVVGAGLAGLACARRLHAGGIAATVLEASDGVGGRVRTDALDGFLLDRGFQVLLTAYPEACQVLDYDELELRAFEPGALVRTGGRFVRVSDPSRRPRRALSTALAPVGSLADKARVASLRRRVLAGSLEELFTRPETSTIQALAAAGFSDAIVDRFFRPLFGGVLLDPELGSSSRMFEFVYRMFSTGDVALPARGMGAIGEQLADGLPPGSVRLGQRVTAVAPGRLKLTGEGGEQLTARAVVVATDGPSAAGLLDQPAAPGSVAAACLYYAADRVPIDEPLIVLDGEGRGPVNNLCVPSAVAPAYAPEGQALVSAAVIGPDASRGTGPLEPAVLEQLADWFGSSVIGWRHLRTYRIPYAQPAQPPGALDPPERPVRVRPGLYVCGDHRDNASINGALVSGRRAAEALLEDL
jgi:phytoene dehydrogenase-like protein